MIAPSYDSEALEILKGKKNRIILVQKDIALPAFNYRTALNGVLSQEKDAITDQRSDLTNVTELKPSDREVDDLLFASKICKHTKSNTIVIVKNKQLFASGTGQTSRVDALNQAIAKANHFKFDLKGSVMASDAFGLILSLLILSVAAIVGLVSFVAVVEAGIVVHQGRHHLGYSTGRLNKRPVVS